MLRQFVPQSRLQIGRKIDVQHADLQLLIVFWMGAQQGPAEVCHDVEITCSCCNMNFVLDVFSLKSSSSVEADADHKNEGKWQVQGWQQR